MPILNWLGKDKVLTHHLDVPFRTLQKKAEFGEEAEAQRNLIVHGDNLLALKALLPQYEGRVRCIYIDPPYNTGNEAWTYNDNVSDPRMLRWLGNVVGREGEDLSRHDKWLCMMYPRLKLLRQLYWRVSEEKFQQMDTDKRIWWGRDGNNVPSLKRFLSEVKQGLVPQTLWSYTEVGHTQDAKKELLSILEFDTSADVFVTPKPTRLIERILQIATDKDSIVLDSFAGSGTTAHAVLKQNKSDGGTRRFILIEMEDYADSLTAERVRRVIVGRGEGENQVAPLGGGFSYYELGPEMFLEDGSINPDVDIETLCAYIWHVETGRVYAKSNGNSDQRFIGSHEDVSYYFCYDKKAPTILDYSLLRAIHSSDRAYVIYADSCSLSPEFLEKHSIQYRKIPRDIPRM